jgi:hypothetical protein
MCDLEQEVLQNAGGWHTHAMLPVGDPTLSQRQERDEASWSGTGGSHLES